MKRKFVPLLLVLNLIMAAGLIFFVMNRSHPPRQVATGEALIGGPFKLTPTTVPSARVG